MVETHIHVVLTCRDCGKTVDFEDYDNSSVDAAIDKAINDLGWFEIVCTGVGVDDNHLCLECQE